MPKVTVLMAVYNGERHLPGSIESVLDQTFTDFELLIVDDSSTDGSVELVESYTDTRIRVIQNEQNLGQVASLNRGLREARGEIVARLDQDDRSLPRRLELQVALLDAEPAVSVVGTWMTMVDTSGSELAPLDGRLNDYPEFVFALLRDWLPLWHPAVAFRRAVVLELGGYDESIRYAEDQDLWRKLALARHEARVIPEVLGYYLVHDAQQSSQSSEAQRENNHTSLERFLRALDPDVPARDVRLLLTGDTQLWEQINSRAEAARVVAALDQLLARTAARLRLTADEARTLNVLVGEHLARIARRAWRAGRVTDASRVLHVAAANRTGRSRARVLDARYRATSLIAPALPFVRAIRRKVNRR